jgi:hypothetical protein
MKRILYCFIFFFVVNAHAQIDTVPAARFTIGIDAFKCAFGDFEGQVEYTTVKEFRLGFSLGYDKNFLNTGRKASMDFERIGESEGQHRVWSRYLWGEGMAGRFWIGIKNISLEFLYKERNFSYYLFREYNGYAEDGRQIIRGVTLNVRHEFEFGKLILAPAFGLGFHHLTSNISRPGYYPEPGVSTYYEPERYFTEEAGLPAVNVGLVLKYTILQTWKKIRVEERRHNN